MLHCAFYYSQSSEINFHGWVGLVGLGGWVGGGGWLDQVGIRLTQLSTGLKVEAELGNMAEML